MSLQDQRARDPLQTIDTMDIPATMAMHSLRRMLALHARGKRMCNLFTFLGGDTAVENAKYWKKLIWNISFQRASNLADRAWQSHHTVSACL